MLPNCCEFVYERPRTNAQTNVQLCNGIERSVVPDRERNRPQQVFEPSGKPHGRTSSSVDGVICQGPNSGTPPGKNAVPPSSGEEREPVEDVREVRTP